MTLGAFGYGTLVNRHTHSYGGHAARLPGWQRVWQTTSARPAAFLSAAPAPGVEVMGLHFTPGAEDWPGLAAREAHYDKISIAEFGSPTVVYSVPERHLTAGRAPILRSYLDTVLQGFLLEFGEDGPRHFMATTVGWERGIFDDRADRIYPRASIPTPAQTAQFAALLASTPVVQQL